MKTKIFETCIIHLKENCLYKLNKRSDQYKTYMIEIKAEKKNKDEDKSFRNVCYTI